VLVVLLVPKELLHLVPEVAWERARLGGGAQRVARHVPLVLGRLARQTGVAGPLQHVRELRSLARHVHAREVTEA
jgi:hypothetical protein